MCGIAGILSRYQRNGLTLGDVRKSLHHRGPDSNGVWGDENIQLAHTRLAIIDLSAHGHQPMSYADERYWITFNGEIYNYIELREQLRAFGHVFRSETDTEVLLAAYAQWGIACLSRLRGMFAFGIWDKDSQVLFLARDRTGERPLYIFNNEDTLIFTSELKAILTLIPDRPEINPAALDLYFHYQYVPEPGTPFRNIRKLPPAHYLLIGPSNWQTDPKRYWSIFDAEPVEGDAPSLIRAELDHVIDLQLRSDVPVGLALSGGLDSGAIAALAAPKYKDTLHTFSVGYPDRPDIDERNDARDLAKKLRLPFHDVELRTDDLVSFFPRLVHLIDEPIADVAAYGHYSVMKLAAEHGVKVMLTGIGGDELFWGYDWVLDALRLSRKKINGKVFPGISAFLPAIEWITSRKLFKRASHSRYLPDSVRYLLRMSRDLGILFVRNRDRAVFYNVRGDFSDTWYFRNKLYTTRFLDQLPDENPFRPFEVAGLRNYDTSELICGLLFDTWLVSNCLSLGDRTAMSTSLEERLPLLDHKLIELVMGLRKSRSDEQLGHKYWLREAVKDLLPPEVLNRPKKPFEPPYSDWIQSLSKAYKTNLLEGYLAEKGIIRREFLEKLLLRPAIAYSLTYRLIFLEIWLTGVFEGSIMVNNPKSLSYC